MNLVSFCSDRFSIRSEEKKFSLSNGGEFANVREVGSMDVFATSELAVLRNLLSELTKSSSSEFSSSEDVDLGGNLLREYLGFYIENYLEDFLKTRAPVASSSSPAVVCSYNPGQNSTEISNSNLKYIRELIHDSIQQALYMNGSYQSETNGIIQALASNVHEMAQVLSGILGAIHGNEEHDF